MFTCVVTDLHKIVPVLSTQDSNQLRTVPESPTLFSRLCCRKGRTRAEGEEKMVEEEGLGHAHMVSGHMVHKAG